jgi:signal transduction histidine kinase
MKLSIRSRLAVFYTLVFFAVLFLVLSAISMALYRELDQRADRALKIEERWLQNLIESRFSELTFADCDTCENLARELVQELNERYIYRGQFTIIAFQPSRVHFGGREKNIPLLLPEDFLSRKNGFYNLQINNIKSRILVKHQEWGTLALGRENQVFQEVAEEFLDIIHWILPLVIVFVLAGGWIMARLVMRPVVSAVEAAEEITITNLQQRLPEYTREDEFAILVRTLNRMIARIEEGVKRIQQFTQDAAHELRTPLTILRGELELAYQHDSLSDETQNSLQKILDRVISMSKVVDNLMLLAQSDTRSYPVQKSVFRLDEVVREIFEDIQILVEHRPIDVILKRCKAIEIFGDKQLIYRLLLNLCDNALKYTREGYIELSLNRLENTIEFTLKDTGCGIPRDQLPHIFDRFFRVDKSRTSFTGGSGLGLAISQWISNAHGGKIFVNSVEDKGTTFKVLLPVHNPTAAPER